jgi:Protein of unknown function (DUF2946)
MHSTRASKSPAAWIAAFGILMAALAPALSHALRSNSQAGWVQVCSALGSKIVNVDASSDAPRPASDDGHLLEHCPYCSLHAAIDAMTPAPASGLVLLTLSFELPRLFLSAPSDLFAWTAPQSRAPPPSV